MPMTIIKSKGYTVIFIAAVLLYMMSAVVYAHDVPDMEREGSIHITMLLGEEAVPGGTLTLYRVGDIQEKDGDYDFVPAKEFDASGESLKDISAEGLAARLQSYVKTHKLTGLTRIVSEDGTIDFNHLDLGLYLLVQNQAAEGYLEAAPFLVSVPMLEDGVYRYDVIANTKIELEKPPETETEKNKIPGNPAPPRLPQTGQLNWPIPIMAVAGLILFLSGWLLCREGRAEGHNHREHRNPDSAR